MKMKSLVLFPLLVLMSVGARAESDAQFAAIARLAGLNAVALQCRFLDQTQRIKAALVERLPKKRYLGEYFDAKTNMAYMDALARHAACPEKSRLAADIGAAIAGLKTAFSAP